MGVGLICLCLLLLLTAYTEQKFCKFVYQRLPTKVTNRLDFVMKYFVHNKSHGE